MSFDVFIDNVIKLIVSFLAIFNLEDSSEAIAIMYLILLMFLLTICILVFDKIIYKK
ncbi:MAG: hypothetical protein R3Y60_05500 [bacterium]